MQEFNSTDFVLPSDCVGILLTGGNSQPFGANKLALPWGSTSVALSLAESLMSACPTSFEAGVGICSLPQIPDSLGKGYLGAVAAAALHLRGNGTLSPSQCLLVLAADMPLIGPACLKMIARWPGSSSVVPIVRSRSQWLVSRWSPSALNRSISLVASSNNLDVQSALDHPETYRVTYGEWESNDHEFVEVHTQADYEAALVYQTRMQTIGR